MDISIHPTAILEPGALIGSGSTIGPYAWIRAGVSVGKHCSIGAFAILGMDSEIRAPDGSLKRIKNTGATETSATRIFLDDGCSVGAHCVVQYPSGDVGLTFLGRDVMLQHHSSVAHDCHLEDGVTICGGTRLAGHVFVGERAMIGAEAVVHQRVVVGAGVMVGLNTGIHGNCLPFTKWLGTPGRPIGMNDYLLKKWGLTAAQVAAEEKRFDDIVKDPRHHAWVQQNERLKRSLGTV